MICTGTSACDIRDYWCCQACALTMSLLEEGFSSWEKKGKNVDLCNFL